MHTLDNWGSGFSPSHSLSIQQSLACVSGGLWAPGGAGPGLSLLEAQQHGAGPVGAIPELPLHAEASVSPLNTAALQAFVHNASLSASREEEMCPLQDETTFHPGTTTGPGGNKEKLRAFPGPSRRGQSLCTHPWGEGMGLWLWLWPAFSVPGGFSIGLSRFFPNGHLHRLISGVQ